MASGMITLVSLAVLLSSGYAARMVDVGADAPTNKHDKRCTDLEDEDLCLDGVKEADCAWCEGDHMRACLDAEAAYGISDRVATCKGAEPPRNPQCSELLSRKDCLHAGDLKQAGASKDDDDELECAWCEGDVQSCISPEAAYRLSRTVHCEGARPPRKFVCSDLLTRKDCMNAEKLFGSRTDNSYRNKHKALKCAWCDGDAMKSCVDADAASYIKDDVAQCDGAALPDGKCGDIKDEQLCLRGTKDGPCAWCKGGYMPAGCLDEQAAKYLPDMVATCKLGKNA